MSNNFAKTLKIAFVVLLTTQFGCASVALQQEHKKIDQLRNIQDNQSIVFAKWDLAHQKNLVCSEQISGIDEYRRLRDSILSVGNKITNSEDLLVYTKKIADFVSQESAKEKPCLRN